MPRSDEPRRKIVRISVGADADLDKALAKVSEELGVRVTRPEESSDLLIRGLDPEVARKFKTGAGARGLRFADHLAALVALHDEMRDRARKDERASKLLDELGLGTVEV